MLYGAKLILCGVIVVFLTTCVGVAICWLITGGL